MLLLSLLVRMVGAGLGARAGAEGRAMGQTRVLAAIVVITGAGAMGVGTAHAQWCDPVEVAKLLADDGAASDRFGNSVSVDGDTAVIGAEADDDNGSWSGSAYVFMRIGGVWTQQAKLLPTDGAEGDEFGVPVSLSGDTARIGANRDYGHG